MRAAFESYFLPSGFPRSVSRDYIEYQMWDTLQALMIYLKNVLTTLAFLRGLGVGNDGNGDQGASALRHAMIVWVTRDGTATLSGLAFGNPRFTRLFASRAHVKSCRLAAEVARGVAGLIELSSSLAEPRWFLPLVCAAAACNAGAGVVDSCTRSSLMTHFARAQNFADCAAKEGNQDRGVKLFGLVGAFTFLSCGNDDDGATATWSAYACLTVLHLAFNVLAVRALRLDDEEAAPNLSPKKTR